eukprot:2597594-Lingulodinium_polyedra.AAC.1
MRCGGHRAAGRRRRMPKRTGRACPATALARLSLNGGSECGTAGRSRATSAWLEAARPRLAAA